MELTIACPDNKPPHAVGHYTFDDGSGKKYRFLMDPMFNHCEHDGADEAAPFKRVWPYDPDKQPADGAVGIWISIYWNCHYRELLGTAIYCTLEDVYFQSTN
ncbi:1778_t:CDS:1 [Funneliformis caledonium]|uniref:1778_t:CDS:1 n=1 Tax=Funneliformis caledonium TaxID=1117310 RepID=A0A9N9HWS4_9GLOM|nr:1778_t:CDS:1 [Funneliformis caledonium]